MLTQIWKNTFIAQKYNKKIVRTKFLSGTEKRMFGRTTFCR